MAMARRLFPLLVVALLHLPVSLAVISSQPAPAKPTSSDNDLDKFMQRVLARRDESWKKLQQYVLEEKEAFDVTGPGGVPLYGFRRDYSWFIKEGIFVRSPVKADGVTLSEADRRKAEAEWIQQGTRREERRRRRASRAAAMDAQAATADPAQKTPDPAASPDAAPAERVEDVLKQGVEPQFVSAAYFMRF